MIAPMDSSIVINKVVSHTPEQFKEKSHEQVAEDTHNKALRKFASSFLGFGKEMD